MEFRYPEIDSLARKRLIQLHIEIDGVGLVLIQLKIIISNIMISHIYEHDITSDATIIPPIEITRRYIVLMTFVVDLDDDEIRPILQQIRSIIIDGSEIDESPAPSFRMPFEITFKPYRTLIEKKFIVLRIPVGRYIHRLRLIKIIFYQIRRLLWFRIEEIPPRCRFHPVIIITLFLRVGKIVPTAVE